ncbi:YdeI/OmpD-associated family protein [Paenibacillus endoradicis]|uniref:YdeI/OmpD-associated family protein n=1 Tax=Paenibacillus endoradicis TaxID=2972487 RepID=UPI002158DED6|nr:YdeI/OmpD-associated family protein [Paenibacillus endoradicis]MCR8658766.1 YdeI/OmpD-associated family protein [Paenibacillus endoradicis]
MTKTIVDKLNLHKYKQPVVLNMPQGQHLLEGLEQYDTSFVQDSYDLIFAFVLEMSQLQLLVQQVLNEGKLSKGGYLYIAYPKKGNKVYDTYIHRDHLFEGIGADEEGYIGDSSLKFARMVGLNEVFTVVGLKEEVKGNATASSKLSQSVADYVDYIPQVESDLQSTRQLLVIYQQLTPGYRRDWARYVYSAKQDTTRLKRINEMKMILAAGYKSRELYRKDQS